MLKRLFILISFFIAGSAAAQEFPSELWHDGKIVLLEGDTLTGQVKYSQESDIVEYSRDNLKTGIALSAKKVLYFEIFDRTINRYRSFYALPYAVSGDYETPLMFEVIEAGRPMTLLSREKIEYKVVSNPYAMAGTYSRLELDYTYYFLKEDGKIQRYFGSKKDLIHLLRDKNSEVKKYMKANRIRPDRRRDIVRVVAYYNSLFESKEDKKDK